MICYRHNFIAVLTYNNHLSFIELHIPCILLEIKPTLRLNLNRINLKNKNKYMYRKYFVEWV